MYADHARGLLPAHLDGERPATAAALHAVPLVAEPAHDLVERGGAAGGGPPGRGERARVRDAGVIDQDQVEVGAQVLDDRQVEGERAGPVVGDQQRDRLGVVGADVREVQRLPVDLGEELRQRVEPGLGGTPVEVALPVPREALQVVDRDAAAPALAGDLDAPSGAGEPVAQVVQVGLRDVDAEGADVGHRLGLSSSNSGTECFVPPQWSRAERSVPLLDVSRKAPRLSRSCCPMAGGSADSYTSGVETGTC
jgi:hypothetical protein